MKCETCLIVGGGAIATKFHLPRLRQILGCKRIDILEIDSARRSELSLVLGSDKSIRLVSELPSGRYDIAVIATPPKFHADYFARLAGQVSACVIEKPLAPNQAQCHAISELAVEHDIPVFVPLIRRTLSSYGMLNRLYRSRRFGRLQRCTITEGGLFNWQAVSLGSFSADLNGGGVLMDTGPHTIDLLFQIFDKIDLTGAYMDGFNPAIEANVELDLMGDGEVPISLMLSRNRVLSNETVLNFEDATLRVGVRSNKIYVEDKACGNYDVVTSDRADDVDPTFADLFDDYYANYLHTGRSDDVGPAQSIRIAEVIDAAYAGAVPLTGGF